MLIDALRSELGPLRRGPDTRFRLRPDDFEALPALQLGILADATCSAMTRLRNHFESEGTTTQGACGDAQREMASS
ncbi:MAG: hypothetical protein NVS4B10_19470 [Myxococcales bacterium]